MEVLEEVFDGGWIGQVADKAFNGARNSIWALLGLGEFCADACGVDLSEEGLEGGMAI